MKQRGSLYIEDTVWGELLRVSIQKGISKSELAEKYLHMGLAKEPELTTIDRLVHADKALNFELNSMLLLLKIEVKGDFRDKFRVLFNEIHCISKDSPLRSRKGTLETSIFDLLRKVQDYDITLFHEISKEMKGTLKQSYLSLYKKE